jgi:hypothetical protein
MSSCGMLKSGPPVLIPREKGAVNMTLGDGKTSEKPTESVQELIEKRDNLLRLKEAIERRVANISKEEQLEVDALVKRSFDPKCAFDRKHTTLLYTLALDPEQVGWYWKLRERFHRFVHHH